MKLGRRQHPEPVPEPVEVDPLPAFVAAVESMPVQCLMYGDDGRLTVFAAIPLSDDDLVTLNSVMAELPAHPAVTPASWLDQHLDRWHHGRFAGWRLRREHAGAECEPVVHPDLRVAAVRNVTPSAGVHLLGPYVRYGTGQSTGARRVTVDHHQRCVELLFRRTVEAGVPIAHIAALPEHPLTCGVAGPPLPPRDVAERPVPVEPVGGWDPPTLPPPVSTVADDLAEQMRALVSRAGASTCVDTPAADTRAPGTRTDRTIDPATTLELRALVQRVVADAPPVESVAAATSARELQAT